MIFNDDNDELREAASIISTFLLMSLSEGQKGRPLRIWERQAMQWLQRLPAWAPAAAHLIGQKMMDEIAKRHAAGEL